MKIRNIAFFGVMASILGSIGGAYADGTDTTKIIASQSYVDNQITGLSGSVSAATAATDTAVTSISQTNGKITATTGQITAKAISDKDTSVGASSSASDDKVPTTKAVATAIESAVASGDAAITDAATSNVLKIQASDNGKLVKVGAMKDSTAFGTLDASNKGTYTASKDISSGATANSKIFTGNATVNTDADSYFPTVAAVESRIAATDADVATINASDVMTSGITAAKVSTYDGYATTLDGKVDSSKIQDTYSSTSGDPISGKGVADALGDESVTSNAILATDGKIAKVDAVKAAIAYAGNWDGTTTDTGKLQKDTNDGNKLKSKHVSGVAPGNIKGYSAVFTENTLVNTDMDSFVPTIAAVEARVKGAEATAAENKTDSYSSTGTTPVTGVAVASAIGALDFNEIDGSTDGKAVVKISETDGKISASLGTIKNAGIASGADIDYTKMSNALNSVNANATAATCSESSPCMLTYLGAGKGFRWTNLDTNGLSADMPSGS